MSMLPKLAKSSKIDEFDKYIPQVLRNGELNAEIIGV